MNAQIAHINPIAWLDRMIDAGYKAGISDIHLEYLEAAPYRLNIRVRRDGKLIGWPSIEGPPARAVISRIKSKANVGSGSVRKSEEGRYVHHRNSGQIPPETPMIQYEEMLQQLERVDIRLVVLPTIRGETHVLRLSSISRTPKVPELGFSETNLHHVARLFNAANGLTLFAGPVGAGKTTSMYSALDYMGGPGKAVYSVEDPTERALDNVTQIEVNEGAGNSYASVLRSLRRSDLEVLMIGEIRDQETAKAAIQISIAGAKVVSSIHANDSIAALEAMLALSEAGPVQVVQSLRGVISQRLVRKIHQACAGNGCEACQGTGVAGRISIHEVLPMSDDLADAVIHGASRAELLRIAVASGMKTLRQDAQRRLASGETSEKWVAEVLGSE